MTTSTAQARSGGLVLALVSAATFSTSGTFASALLDSGWSSGAAVLVRVLVAALVLTVPAALQLRGRWGMLRRRAVPLVGYGVMAVAACQVCYFNAVQHLSVGIALMLEYLGCFLVVGWQWVRHGQRPSPVTSVGALVAAVGLALVLDVNSSTRLDVVGVLWGLGAAAGLATYFVLAGNSEEEVPPLVLAWAGLTVGSVGLAVVGAAGGLALHASTRDVLLRGAQVPWWVAVAGLSLVAAVIAYVTGMAGTRRLGARVASFVGLTEVLFAVLIAWAVLGQLPAPVQALGALVILAGVTLVRVDELRSVRAAHRASETADDQAVEDAGAVRTTVEQELRPQPAAGR